MALQHQIDSRQTLRDLIANPLNTLQNVAFNVGQLPGIVTQSTSLHFGYLQNEVRIGPNAFARNFMINGIEADAVIRVQGLASPMRGAGVMGRLGLTARFAPGANQVWVTDQQTGCSVLVLQWPGNQYSMVHLQPNADNEFNRFSRYLINRYDNFRAGYKNLWLKKEVTAVVNASVVGGVYPQRYILIQSNFNTMAGREMQIIGVRNGGGWSFFQQVYQYDMFNGVYNIINVRNLAWTNWHAYVPYMAY
jgi:hypothetical protein